jgi:hypothetical protein
MSSRQKDEGIMYLYKGLHDKGFDIWVLSEDYNPTVVHINGIVATKYIGPVMYVDEDIKSGRQEKDRVFLFGIEYEESCDCVTEYCLCAHTFDSGLIATKNGSLDDIRRALNHIKTGKKIWLTKLERFGCVDYVRRSK